VVPFFAALQYNCLCACVFLGGRAGDFAKGSRRAMKEKCWCGWLLRSGNTGSGLKSLPVTSAIISIISFLLLVSPAHFYLLRPVTYSFLLKTSTPTPCCPFLCFTPKFFCHVLGFRWCNVTEVRIWQSCRSSTKTKEKR